MIRKLLIIPVFHSETEMGSIKQEMRRTGEKIFGREKWEEHRKHLKEFWEKIENTLEKKLKKVDINKIKIYQDGQVVDGQIGIKIIEEIADKGSKNYQIISNLIKKGATPMKTENLELIKEEYTLIKKIVGAKTLRDRMVAVALYRKRKDGLLKERDRYIGENINETLKNREFGLLFIGAIHNVESELPKNIKVEHLDGIDDVSHKLLGMLHYFSV